MELSRLVQQGNAPGVAARGHGCAGLSHQLARLGNIGFPAHSQAFCDVKGLQRKEGPVLQERIPHPLAHQGGVVEVHAIPIKIQDCDLDSSRLGREQEGPQEKEIHGNGTKALHIVRLNYPLGHTQGQLPSPLFRL